MRFLRTFGAPHLTALSILSISVGKSSRVCLRTMLWDGTGRPQFILMTGPGSSLTGMQQ